MQGFEDFGTQVFRNLGIQGFCYFGIYIKQKIDKQNDDLNVRNVKKLTKKKFQNSKKYQKYQKYQQKNLNLKLQENPCASLSLCSGLFYGPREI